MKKAKFLHLTFSSLLLCFLTSSMVNAQENEKLKKISCSQCSSEETKQIETMCYNLTKRVRSYGYTIDNTNSECNWVNGLGLSLWTPKLYIKFNGDPARIFIADRDVISTGACYYLATNDTKRNIRDWECK